MSLQKCTKKENILKFETTFFVAKLLVKIPHPMCQNGTNRTGTYDNRQDFLDTQYLYLLLKDVSIFIKTNLDVIFIFSVA